MYLIVALLLSALLSLVGCRQADPADDCITELMDMGYFILPLGADVHSLRWTPPDADGDVESYWVDVQFKMMSDHPAAEFAIIGPADSVMVRVQGVDGAWHRSVR